MTPTLWSTIQKALDSSDHFVLLASPEAARSRWVGREIEHWIGVKSADRILPVRVTLSPNGRALVLSRDGSVELWKRENRSEPKLAATLHGDPPDGRWYRESAFSPDGRTLVTESGGGGPDEAPRYATIWNVTDLTQPTELSFLYDPRDSYGEILEFSSEGRTLLIGTHVWDVTDRGKPVIRSVIEADVHFDAMALSPAVPPRTVGPSPPAAATAPRSCGTSAILRSHAGSPP